MEELRQLRDEKSFEKIFQTITIFCQQNNVNLNQKPKHRKRVVSTRFKDSVIISTIGQRDDESEYYYRTYIYYQVIDNMLVELEDGFSSKSLQLLSGISSLCPDSNTFLDFDSLKPIANHLNVDLQVLSNELMVVKLVAK
ncbi:unnamed protein product [Rotaria sp. Silwood2]|nr:unnamed protein product [Rotaria sp. Silwood2]CAF3565515.1 unnamed protein product [Rotaria sp. Silwood2]